MVVLVFAFIFVSMFIRYDDSKTKNTKVQHVKKEHRIEQKAKDAVKYIRMKATAYTAGFESTGKTKSSKSYGITASGNKVQEGRTIACPRTMSFGTKVFIKEMNKTYVCEDRGSAITNGRIDIYIASLDKAEEFGVKEVNVLVQK